MRLNTQAFSAERTHEGSPAKRLTPEQTLRRSVLSCLLWEKTFYEDGVSVAERIERACELVSPETIASLAVEARTKFHLRHVPLLLLKSLVKHGSGRMVSDCIAETIQRADELSEFVAVYWAEGRKPLSNPMKKGLAKAFTKFSAHQLAKYNRRSEIRLRDVLFLCHAKPKDDEQRRTWSSLIDGTLSSPETWEVLLSSGSDKKQTFERLIREGRLGYLALLRNLRNMVEAGCDESLVKNAILGRLGAERVLPFRYVAAARAVPMLESALDIAMLASISELPKFDGRTIVLVDVSGSMDSLLSSKSDMTAMDAAAAIASMVNGDCRVFTFSDSLKEIPHRRGLAGVDAVVNSQQHGGTRLGDAVSQVNALPHDRLIVITDEQSFDYVPDPEGRGYMINVRPYKSGVGYGAWTHIDGFSEQVLRFIHETEASI